MNQLKLAYEIARAEIGVQEIAGVKHNERILDYHAATTTQGKDDETPWCSAFVNWCMIQAGFLIDRFEMAEILKEHNIDGGDDSRLLHAGLGDEFREFSLEPVIAPTLLPHARSWLSWGEDTKDPQPGDIVVLKRGDQSWQGHVGFFVKRDPLTVTVLGGNQNDQVKESRFMRARVLGYRTIRT